MYESYSKKKNHERSSHFKVAKTNNTELAPNMLTCYVFIKVFTVTQVCCCTSDFHISAVKGLESLHRRVGPVKGGNKNSYKSANVLAKATHDQKKVHFKTEKKAFE